MYDLTAFFKVDCSNPFLCPPKSTAAGRRPRVKSNVRVKQQDVLRIFIKRMRCTCRDIANRVNCAIFFIRFLFMHLFRQRNAISGTEQDRRDPLVEGIVNFYFCPVLVSWCHLLFSRAGVLLISSMLLDCWKHKICKMFHPGGKSGVGERF